MTKEKQFLLDVLKSFIHEEKLDFDVEADWEELLKLSTIHNITGILGYMAMQNPCERTAKMTDMLKKQCFANVAVFTRRAENAKRLLTELSHAGIDNMAFKGYVLRNYYPVPELRTYGDIDILIKAEDREKCHRLMTERGYAVKTDWEPVFSYNTGSELYEIHTEIMEIDVSDKADYKGYFRTAWEHVIKNAEHSFEPAPEFHFLYLLTHIAKHIFGSGAGIRMYMDIAVFIKHFDGSIDWNYISNELNELKLRGFANMALTVVEKYFDVASPIALEDVAPDTLEDFMEYTMDGGIFGHFGRDSALVTLKKADDESRIRTLFRRMLPPADTIESRYTYLQGRHWLLPVAWVHRFIKTSDKFSQHAKEAKSLIQTDEAEVEKLKRIYKTIGL